MQASLQVRAQLEQHSHAQAALLLSLPSRVRCAYPGYVTSLERTDASRREHQQISLKSTLSHPVSRPASRAKRRNPLMMNTTALSKHFSQVTAGKIQMLRRIAHTACLQSADGRSR
ncbi:MAG: hypothetical protein ACN6RK_04155 [Stenotrophomonas sp.]